MDCAKASGQGAQGRPGERSTRKECASDAAGVCLEARAELVGHGRLQTRTRSVSIWARPVIVVTSVSPTIS